MNQLQPTVNTAKIQIPTGYEQQQREAATKRRLAEVMLSQGLASDPNMNNYAQLFGKLAQAFVGKRLDNQATKAEVGVQQSIRNDYLTAREQLQADIAAGMPAQELLNKHGSNPLLREELKPYEGVLQKQLEAPVDIATAAAKDRGQLTEFGGRMVSKGSVEGQYANSPTSMVHANSDGTTMLNPVAVTAAAISQGNLVPDGAPATTGRIPGVSNIAQAMAGAQQPQPATPTPAIPAGEVISAQDVFRFKNSMPPQAFMEYFKAPGRAVQLQPGQFPEQLGLPPGTRLILPDGSEGWAQ